MTKKTYIFGCKGKTGNKNVCNYHSTKSTRSENDAIKVIVQKYLYVCLFTNQKLCRLNKNFLPLLSSSHHSHFACSCKFVCCWSESKPNKSTVIRHSIFVVQWTIFCKSFDMYTYKFFERERARHSMISRENIRSMIQMTERLFFCELEERIFNTNQPRQHPSHPDIIDLWLILILLQCRSLTDQSTRFPMQYMLKRNI